MVYRFSYDQTDIFLQHSTSRQNESEFSKSITTLQSQAKYSNGMRITMEVNRSSMRLRPTLSWPVLVACLVLSSISVLGVPVNQQMQKESPGFRQHSDEALLPIHLSAPEDKGPRQFLDTLGRIRVFHGVNAVVKGPPWHPSFDQFDYKTSLQDLDFELLRDAGVNIIRLGTMWAGIEPERGQYNETYIDVLFNMARNASKYGIYTLLDMHQDVMSEKFCGEGMPAWAVQPSGVLHFPEPVKSAYKKDADSGVPTRADCDKLAWSRYYFAEETGTAFQALYDNKDGLLDAWAEMWATIARKFKGEPHILGVELINEPWAGDVVHDPLLLVPGHADKVNLQKVYDRLSAAVWAADPDRLVFFAGVTWDNLGTGFEHAPGKVPEKAVLAYHYYEFPDGPQLKNSSGGEFAIQLQEAGRLGTGAMLTEFGEPGFAGEGSGQFEGAAASAEVLGQSWACWEYKTFCREPKRNPSQEGDYGACKTGFGGMMWTKEGEVSSREYRSLARPYAAAVAGRVVAAGLDAGTEVYTLEYVPDMASAAPTLIKVPSKVRYAKGFKMMIQPPGAAHAVQVDSSTVELTPDASQPVGTVVAFSVAPLSPEDTETISV